MLIGIRTSLAAQARSLPQTAIPPSVTIQELSIICIQLFITLPRLACGMEGELLL
jgi:hypothetical protein